MGIELPAGFMAEPVTTNDIKLVSVTLGWTLCFALFTAVKAGRQTYHIWQRTHNWKSLFLWLVWGEWSVNVAFAVANYLLFIGKIVYGFPYLFGIVTLWVQFIPQIILNRISLIAVDQRRVFRLKILVAVLVGLINISVYCIWIPARMEVSPEFIRVNDIWDRMEKGLYAILDLSLNVYFLYLVRTRLLRAGLSKYNRLFWYNAAVVCVSISLDIVLIGMMSLANDLLYGQFHPVTFLAKLHIELTMADLIAKVAASTQRAKAAGPHQNRSDSRRASSRTTDSRCSRCSKCEHEEYYTNDDEKKAGP